MARMAYKRYQADWVINNDADEFWWPKPGTLKSALESVPISYSIGRVQRHNMPIHDVNSNAPFYLCASYKLKNSLNPVGNPLPTKVCHRGNRSIEVKPGAHGVTGFFKPRIFDLEIEVFHYPIRRLEQMRRKMENISTGYEKNPQIDKRTLRGPGFDTRGLYATALKEKSVFEKSFAQYTVK